MKKDNKNHGFRKWLSNLGDALGELFLALVCSAIGFGLICLFTSFDFAKEMDFELVALVGFAAVLVFICVGALILYLIDKKKKK